MNTTVFRFASNLRTNSRAPALSSVEWRDLVRMTTWEKAWELGLSLPWLMLSLWLYGRGWWWLAAPASFYFFLTGLRQSHNAQHYAMDLPMRIQDGMLFALSVAMLASMHAVQVTHLHHHRHCLDTHDVEGATAKGTWWQSFLAGPLFVVRLHRAAWKMANAAKRRWILVEMIAIAGWIAFVAVMSDSAALNGHVAAMLLGECFTGFFAVWTVHHDCGLGFEAGRTQRNRWFNAITYHMFLHREHHLFPAVPTGHLPQLAARLDRVHSSFLV